MVNPGTSIQTKMGLTPTRMLIALIRSKAASQTVRTNACSSFDCWKNSLG